MEIYTPLCSNAPIFFSSILFSFYPFSILIFQVWYFLSAMVASHALMPFGIFLSSWELPSTITPSVSIYCCLWQTAPFEFCRHVQEPDSVLLLVWRRTSLLINFFVFSWFLLLSIKFLPTVMKCIFSSSIWFIYCISMFRISNSFIIYFVARFF